MKEKVAIYPGSFDPLTLGHYDVLIRAADIFEKVYIAVAINIEKHPIFTLQERKIMIESAIKNNNYTNIEVITFDGLITTFMKQKNIKVLVRGVRDSQDFLNESRMSRMNKTLYPEMDTIFFHTTEAYAHISSSLIKEIVRFGGNLNFLVPNEIIASIEDKFKILPLKK